MARHNMINSARIKPLNNKPAYNGDFVIYWMQASQRCEYNHALHYSIEEADKLNKPVIVYFGLTDGYPEANLRHYYFMIEGLKEVQESLKQMGIQLILRLESPELGVIQLANRACLVVVDKGYLRIQRQWRNNVAARIDCPLIEVESDVVVPVSEASSKEEYSAATIRPKIKRKINDFLVALDPYAPKTHSLALDFETTNIGDINRLLQKLNIDRNVLPVNEYHGGIIEAKKYLKLFLNKHLDIYSDLRSDPSVDYLSKMSPYLHFGQISPIYIALETLSRHSPGVETFFEELVVRRELSMNFVNYNSSYDSLKGIPEWARMTLKEHNADVREYIYDTETLEHGNTHDKYWNAAQKELLITGRMHGSCWLLH